LITWASEAKGINAADSAMTAAERLANFMNVLSRVDAVQAEVHAT
jgi:hypothetical protein